MSIFTSIFYAPKPHFNKDFLAVLSTKKIGGFLLAVLINENLIKPFVTAAVPYLENCFFTRFYILSLL